MLEEAVVVVVVNVVGWWKVRRESDLGAKVGEADSTRPQKAKPPPATKSRAPSLFNSATR